jgi:hypothetical protein
MQPIRSRLSIWSVPRSVAVARRGGFRRRRAHPGALMLAAGRPPTHELPPHRPCSWRGPVDIWHPVCAARLVCVCVCFGARRLAFRSAPLPHLPVAARFVLVVTDPWHHRVSTGRDHSGWLARVEAWAAGHGNVATSFWRRVGVVLSAFLPPHASIVRSRRCSRPPPPLVGQRPVSAGVGPVVIYTCGICTHRWLRVGDPVRATRSCARRARTRRRGLGDGVAVLDGRDHLSMPRIPTDCR